MWIGMVACPFPCHASAPSKGQTHWTSYDRIRIVIAAALMDKTIYGDLVRVTGLGGSTLPMLQLSVCN